MERLSVKGCACTKHHLQSYTATPGQYWKATLAEMQYNIMNLLFYDALWSTTNEVLEKISEEYMEKELRDYWAKNNKQILSSPSVRYVGLHKAMVIVVMNPVIKDQQQAIMEVIRQMSNACMTSRYILD